MWLWLLASCVLGPRPDACTANADCRDGFGFGSVCGDDGYCAEVEVSPRCTTTFPADLFRNPSDYDDALILGSIFNIPGDIKQQNSMQLAIQNVRDAQKSTGAFGQDVAIIHCDNAENIDYDNLDSVEAAVSAAEFLVDTLGVPAILGPSTSDEAFAVFDVASKGDTIVISPSATSPGLTEVGGFPTESSPGLFWRTVPPDDLQAIAIAQDLRDRDVSSITILNETSSYASSLADAVQANFESPERVVRKLSYADATSLSNQTPKAFDQPNDEVLFFTSLSSDVVVFLDRAVAGGISDRQVFLADAAADSTLFEADEGSALFPFIRGTRPEIPKGPLYELFVGNYGFAFDDKAEDSVFTSYSYDAAWLALFGAMWATAEGEVVSGTSIGQGILRMSKGDSYDVGYDDIGAIREAFEAGESIDLNGASGTLDFDLVTGEVNNPIEVWIVDEANSDFIPVKICDTTGVCESVK